MALAATLMLAGCAEPELAEPEPEEGAEAPLSAADPDPLRDELLAQLDELLAAVEAVRAQLAPALEADDVGTANAVAADAVVAMLGDGGADDAPALFPAEIGEAEREGAGDDAVTATLSLAREAGGDLGRTVVEVLRDPVAGDLGAWERDPEGVIASAEAALQDVTDLDAGIEAAATLDGDGTRALAWLLLARDGDEVELVRSAVERADGHLGVVAVAVGIAREDTAGGDDPATGPDDGAELPEELDDTQELDDDPDAPLEDDTEETP